MRHFGYVHHSNSIRWTRFSTDDAWITAVRRSQLAPLAANLMVFFPPLEGSKYKEVTFYSVSLKSQSALQVCVLYINSPCPEYQSEVQYPKPYVLQVSKPGIPCPKTLGI